MDVSKMIALGILGKKASVAIPWYLSGGIASANCIAAYQAKGAASLAASKVNLVNSLLYPLVASASDPTFDTSTGWTFGGDASTQGFGATGLTGPGTANMTIAIRWTAYTEAGIPVGWFGTNGQYLNISTATYTVYVNGANTVAGNQAGLNANNVLIGAGLKLFRNGSQILTDVVDGTRSSVLAFRIGSQSAITGFWAGVIVAVSVYNAALSTDQITALTVSMNAL